MPGWAPPGGREVGRPLPGRIETDRHRLDPGRVPAVCRDRETLTVGVFGPRTNRSDAMLRRHRPDAPPVGGAGDECGRVGRELHRGDGVGVATQDAHPALVRRPERVRLVIGHRQPVAVRTEEALLHGIDSRPLDHERLGIRWAIQVPQRDGLACGRAPGEAAPGHIERGRELGIRRGHSKQPGPRLRSARRVGGEQRQIEALRILQRDHGLAPGTDTDAERLSRRQRGYRALKVWPGCRSRDERRRPLRAGGTIDRPREQSRWTGGRSPGGATRPRPRARDHAGPPRSRLD